MRGIKVTFRPKKGQLLLMLAVSDQVNVHPLGLDLGPKLNGRKMWSE
jgi:hypothetical protein